MTVTGAHINQHGASVAPWREEPLRHGKLINPIAAGAHDLTHEGVEVHEGGRHGEEQVPGCQPSPEYQLAESRFGFGLNVDINAL